MSAERDDTARAVLASMVVATLMVAQLVASRAVRDGFFLTYYSSAALPTMMLASAGFSLAVVIGSTRLLRSVAPVHSLPYIFIAGSVLFAVEWGLAQAHPRIASVVLYLHVMSLSALISSGFWSIINERFDPYTAKRLIGRIAGGASLGGVLGGIAAFWGASALEIPTMIGVLGLLNVVCAICVMQIGTGAHAQTSSERPPGSALQIVRDVPYLQHLALLVTLSAFTQACYDYVFKARAAAYFDSGADLVSFFALFYMSLNVVTFVVQNLLAGRALARFGLSVSVGLLPGSGAILGALAFFVPGLASATTMRGGIGAVENSLFRSGYELLYTPIVPEKKRPTKTLIDVGGDKAGTALGAAVALIVVAVAPTVAGAALVLGGIAASVAALYVTRQLHRGYIAALTDSLRAGSVRVEEVEVRDATTQIAVEEAREALQQTGGASEEGATRAIDRKDVMRDVRARPDSPVQQPAARPEPAPFRPEPLAALDLTALDPTTTAIARLRSRDPRAVRRVLLDQPSLPAELVPHVIPLLDLEPEAAVAAECLRRVAPANTGILLDAAQEPANAAAVRYRVCEILSRVPTQRCADGLIRLLHDADFELRFRAASSLLEVHRSGSGIRIDSEQVFEAAQREAGLCRRLWRSRASLDPRIDATAPIHSQDGQRVMQGATYIWTLLLTVLEPEPLTLAIRALARGESAHRGTGLEYMENVLPPRLLSTLSPLLEDARLAPGDVQARSAVLSELASKREPSADLAALRRHVDALRQRGGSRPAPGE